jgi:FtsP/CotA-like multicopper oxidase with cupredoxin domain
LLVILASTFHMHSVPFWITQMDGVALDPPIWRDTAPVYSNMTVHVCFPEDHLGLINIHCHMPGHQDTGMGIYYKVVPAGPDDDTDAPTESPTNNDSAASVSYS